jgi:hypothetical protein
MILLMVVIPTSAYDYQGPPRPGENNFEGISSSFGDIGDIEEILENVDFASLVSMLLLFIFQLFGIPVTGIE